MSQTRLAKAKRLVVKVGSALVTNNGAGLDLAAINDWARQISALRRQGKEVVLVSSGAIACGMQRLGWEKRPKTVHELQAAAAVGAHQRQSSRERALPRLDPRDRISRGLRQRRGRFQLPFSDLLQRRHRIRRRE